MLLGDDQIGVESMLKLSAPADEDAPELDGPNVIEVIATTAS
jgi:hypothetical protein